jgi:CheY-like chemotaxis protein
MTARLPNTLNATPAHRGKIVLAVDDAPENLLVLHSMVEAAGFTFMGAKSGQECLSLAYRVAPSVFLLDIEMPKPDGFETCRHLRTRRELRSVPIAFLTARNSADDLKEGLAAGGNDFSDDKQVFDIAENYQTRRGLLRKRHFLHQDDENPHLQV